MYIVRTLVSCFLKGPINDLKYVLLCSSRSPSLVFQGRSFRAEEESLGLLKIQKKREEASR